MKKTEQQTNAWAIESFPLKNPCAKSLGLKNKTCSEAMRYLLFNDLTYKKIEAIKTKKIKTKV